MSLDKAIKHGREHRKPYYDGKRCCRECCNHGGCDYCRNARLHNEKRRIEKIRHKVKEYENSGYE